jgi:outer membrane receptor for monomeric catechols
VIDVAGFILDTKNELIKDTATNEWTNAGETRRFGFESMVKAVPVKWFEVFGKFSWIDSEILENPNAALEGKELKSIPKKSRARVCTRIFPRGSH